MAASSRKPAGDLAAPLLEQARHYAFFSLVEQLHRIHGDDLEHAADQGPAAERIRFACDPRVCFPTSDVLAGEGSIVAGQQAYRIVVSFLGLHGVDSPLPPHYLERVATEHASGTGLHAAFLDFFHHRLLTLLHRGWRRYRYHVRFQPGASDHFSRCVLSLIGLGDHQQDSQASIPVGRLLTYAGIVASRSRSPAMVAGIVAHCFDLQDVSVREFERTQVEVAVEQRGRLGGGAHTLGRDVVVGDRVATREHRFVIAIGDLCQQRFRDFLPDGSGFDALRALVEFLLRDPLAYDLELRLRQQDVSPFRLDRRLGGHLGWTSFLAEGAGGPGDARVRIRGRA